MKNGAKKRYLRNKGGSILIEFGIVAFILYFLIAGIVTMGTMIFSVQHLQDTARQTARELALIPLPANITFEQAMLDPVVRAQVFDSQQLVIDEDAVEMSGQTMDEYFASLPVINRMLRPLMIRQEIIDEDGDTRRLLRYPGALLRNDTTPSGFDVGVPLVSYGADGSESITWLPVIQEVESAANPDPFQISSPERGLVALRLNYPYNAATLGGYRQEINEQGFEVNKPIEADDSAVQPAPPNGTLFDPGQTVGPYAGQYGLGRQLAWAKTVRPFRKVITAQSFYRRETIQ